MTDERRIEAGIVATAVLCYVMALGGQWTLDDPYIIVGNPLVHTPAVLWRAFTHPYWPAAFGWGQYRPLATLSFALDWAVSHGAPWWFHLVNIAWHAAASLLVWRLARMLLPAAGPGALVAALWFAVQPVHVEAVAGVVGRSEIMAAAFVMAGLLAHAKVQRWAVLWYALALLSKESGAVLPGITLCYDLLYATDWKARRRLYVGYGAVLTAYGVILFLLFHGHELVEPAPLWVGMPAVDRWLTMGAAIPQYARLMILPAQLLIDYGPMVVAPQHELSLPVLIGLVFLVASLAAVIGTWRRAPVVAFGLLWFAVSVAPVANILYASGVVVAERTLYLPSVGVALVIGWVGARLVADRGAVAIAGLALGGVLLAARTWTRVPFWHDTKSVVIGALGEEPDSHRIHVLAAGVLVQNGHWREAAAQYARARSLFANDPKDYRAGAECALALQEPDAAMALLDSAIALAPTDPAPVLRLAEAKGTVGDWRGAIAAARRAYALAPDSLRAVRLVQIAGGRVGDTAVVDTAFRRALADHPNNSRLRLAFATMLRQRGDTAAERRVELPGLGSR